MNEIQHSDEQLNAFIDNELTIEERLELLQEATASESLRRRLVEQQYLKALTQASYPTPRQSTAGQPPVTTRGLNRYLAAAAIGALSLFAVMTITGTVEMLKVPAHTATARVEKPTDQQLQQTRVIFHISSDRREDAALLLDQVELTLKAHQASGIPLRVEVVANNQGLRLMQQGRSPFPKRIHQLSETYPNLVFAACGSTLARITKTTGEKIKILPDAVIIRSGVSFITRHQQSGWAYIKV